MTAKKTAKKSARKSTKRAAKKVAKKVVKRAAKKGTARKMSLKKSTAKKSARKAATKKSAHKSPAKKSARKLAHRHTDDDGCGDHSAQAEFTSNPSVEAAPKRGRLRARNTGTSDKPSVGLVKVAADKLKDGYSSAWIRTDLQTEYNEALATIRALGGIMTSSGAIRDLGAGAGPGRSKTSFHYSGRAFDLFIGTGMSGASDRYIIQRSGGTPELPEWEVLCVSENPLTSDPHYDASLIKDAMVDYVTWKSGVGLVSAKRQVKYFSLSAVLKKFGWVNIPARSDWKTQYLSCEWWHFQHHKGLKEGVSKFGDELRAVWPTSKVAASGLALDAIFKGRSFRA
ncbi:MAG: hypothetical protein ACO1Q7_13805 [Gemmatimonas sp.]